MTERESAADIEAAAARWVVRADRGDLDPAELDVWLAADTRRQGAYVRAQAAWGLLDRGRVLGGEERAAPPRRRIDRRGLLAGLGAAAAACVAVVVAPRLLSARYGTTLGEIRRVPLADGSLAAINTDTTLEVAMKPRRREVRLDRGEVWFQVAKDADRPFVVESGPVRVRAVGTAFSVRRRDGGCEVLVTEGVVEVWSEGAGEAPRRVTAGERVFASDSAGAARPVLASLEITRELAWREGQIVLDGEAFGAAAQEFNRYNARKIVIADPDLAEQKLVGWFRTNEPESFARAAAASFGARVTVRGDAILVQSVAPLAE
ncbi:iron dicitrate transport regulator FecR [Caulobacter flavus]|uniref:Iron dicitrate transport regulator FecR n=1 Tax=Caulobacter flavus TaxID=1679497 RepID=A0A2N5CTK9_9CAUL|nr:FecR domain-containing protein [Caulobacter flavus]AYV47724.1 iron dicitrate transport regulator FecR [Caulobacter flavus]PLR15401.1 iron dicitrate transport regulator FecR [Caulobacter flavus]